MMNIMRKYTSIGVAAGVLAGGALGFGLSATGITSAAPSSGTAIPSAVIAQETSEEETSTHPRRDEMRGRMLEHLQESLAPLVEDGTLNEVQLQAVITRLQESHAERATEMRAKRAERRSQMGSERQGLGPMGPRR